MKNLHHFGFGLALFRGVLFPEETDPGLDECALLDLELEREDFDRADAEANAFRRLPEDRLLRLEDLLELCLELPRLPDDPDLRAMSNILFRPEPFLPREG